MKAETLISSKNVFGEFLTKSELNFEISKTQLIEAFATWLSTFPKWRKARDIETWYAGTTNSRSRAIINAFKSHKDESLSFSSEPTICLAFQLVLEHYDDKGYTVDSPTLLNELLLLQLMGNDLFNAQSDSNLSKAAIPRSLEACTDFYFALSIKNRDFQELFFLRNFLANQILLLFQYEVLSRIDDRISQWWYHEKTDEAYWNDLLKTFIPIIFTVWKEENPTFEVNEHNSPLLKDLDILNSNVHYDPHLTAVKQFPMLIHDGKASVISRHLMTQRLGEHMFWSMKSYSKDPDFISNWNNWVFPKICLRLLSELPFDFITDIDEHLNHAIPDGHRKSDFIAGSGDRILIIECKDFLLNKNQETKAGSELFEQTIWNEKLKKFPEQILSTIRLGVKNNWFQTERSRLEITPVVLASNSMFDARGLNRLVDQKWTNEVKRLNFKLYDKIKLNRPVLINIRTLISPFLLQNRPLIPELLSYLKSVKMDRKNAFGTKSPPLRSESYQASFSEYCELNFPSNKFEEELYMRHLSPFIEKLPTN